FWQYGEWVDVVIDDYLPTRFGKLMFIHSKDEDEYWTALIEKAYAKLHGSYEALKGGTTCEALVDFTGGCTEMYQLKERDVPRNLFQILQKAYERCSLKGCSMEPDPNVLEARTDVGLVRGHAYSITKVLNVQIQTPQASGKIPMMRIHGSAEWQFIPDEEKDNIGVDFGQDGEFWMTYKDFMKYFDQLEICNLTPDSLENLDDFSDRPSGK
ncbi:CalpainB, partial [Caligus rogercresseyi]